MVNNNDSRNYDEPDKHIVAINCVVFGYDNDGLQTLVINRLTEPEKGKTALIGGFINHNEGIEDAAKRILYSITGTTHNYIEQLTTFGNKYCETGKHIITVTCYSLVKKQELEKNNLDKHGAYWLPFSKKNSFAFNQNETVEYAIRILNRRCKTQPVAFELLPEKFTIPQLQQLYETIYSKELDKRNFRKKILSLNILNKLEEKDKKKSKKGAYLYHFNEEKYKRLISNGFYFDI